MILQMNIGVCSLSVLGAITTCSTSPRAGFANFWRCFVPLALFFCFFVCSRFLKRILTPIYRLLSTASEVDLGTFAGSLFVSVAYCVFLPAPTA